MLHITAITLLLLKTQGHNYQQRQIAALLAVNRQLSYQTQPE